MPGRVLLACLLLAATAGATEPPPGGPFVVSSVRIEGLGRTDPLVVLRELPWRPGEELSPERWALGWSRLWNLGLFSRVEARLEGDGEERVAVFVVEERITVVPLIDFSTAGSMGWLRLGLSDINLFGHFLEAGALYERFGAFNGGQLWVRDPRLFGTRLDGRILLERLARPRPEFVSFRSLLRLDLSASVHPADRLRLLGRVDLFSDDFAPPAGETRRLPRRSGGGIFTAGARLGRVDAERLRQRGWSVDLLPALGVSTDPEARLFVQLLAEARGHLPLGQRWQLAARARGTTTSAALPQHRLYVGGLDLVRGLEDNAIRTDALLGGNVELRLIAWDSTWLALLPALFVDAVVARGEETPLVAAASAGGGLRFVVPRLVESGLRADVAVPLGSTRPIQISFGAYQFF